MANFGLAVNRRWRNQQTNEWEEEVAFFDIVCWRDLAENVSESLTKGTRVMVSRPAPAASWEADNGDKRSKVEVLADEVGPSLRWATARCRRPNAVRAAAVVEAGSTLPPRRHRRPAATTTKRSRSDGEAPDEAQASRKDTGRRVKKKISILNTEAVEYVDWKDANLLRRFMSDRAKIRARRVTGNDIQQQRDIAKAIKNAREMALIPYTNRVTTQRGGRRDRDGDDRRGPRA